MFTKYVWSYGFGRMFATNKIHQALLPQLSISAERSVTKMSLEKHCSLALNFVLGVNAKK